jgi:Adenylylsulfate kinase and related kinases
LARKGKIKEFTGISDPYENPEHAEIVINSDGIILPEKLVDIIFNKIIEIGYISP